MKLKSPGPDFRRLCDDLNRRLIELGVHPKKDRMPILEDIMRFRHSAIHVQIDLRTKGGYFWAFFAPNCPFAHVLNQLQSLSNSKP